MIWRLLVVLELNLKFYYFLLQRVLTFIFKYAKLLRFSQSACKRRMRQSAKGIAKRFG